MAEFQLLRRAAALLTGAGHASDTAVTATDDVALAARAERVYNPNPDAGLVNMHWMPVGVERWRNSYTEGVNVLFMVPPNGWSPRWSSASEAVEGAATRIVDGNRRSGGFGQFGGLVSKGDQFNVSDVRKASSNGTDWEGHATAHWLPIDDRATELIAASGRVVPKVEPGADPALDRLAAIYRTASSQL